jgi:hypothetical protein
MLNNVGRAFVRSPDEPDEGEQLRSVPALRHRRQVGLHHLRPCGRRSIKSDRLVSFQQFFTNGRGAE